MTDLFEDELLDEDLLVEGETDDDIDLSKNEVATLDARRRLEKMLEERRLKAELDDFF